MVCFYIDAEKDYVYLCLKKWMAHVEKEELIPKLEVDFYVSECVKVTPLKKVKASNVEVMIGETNSLSREVYEEKLYCFLNETFKKVWKRDR